jgi:hypothetical protein
VQPYEIHSRLDLAPGRYEIRVAADSPSGRRGSVFTFVDVPDFTNAALALSGVVLSASPAPPSAPSRAFADLMPVTPSLRRAFDRSDRASAFVEVHQAAAPKPVSVSLQVAARNGRLVIDDTRTIGVEAFRGGHPAEVMLELPIARLDPGEYLFVVQASIGPDQVRRNVPFSVR